MENCLGPCPSLGQSPPPRVTGTRVAVTDETIPNKINVHVVSIGGPMALEISQERRPVEREMVLLEIRLRK
jgi:hypothetical protein